MANVLDSLGRAAEAVESCKRALTINPGNAEAHFNLGALATTRGRHEEAAHSLRRAVEIKPDFAKAHHSLGTALSSLGQLDAAEESLSRALSIEPESAEILYDLGMSLLSRGKYASAVPLFACLLKRSPTLGTKIAFANCAARTQFTTNDSQIRVVLRPQSHWD